MLKMLLYLRHTQQHRCVQVWDGTYFYSKPDIVLIRQNPFLFKTGRNPLLSKLAQHNYKRTSTQIYMNREGGPSAQSTKRELISAGKTSWSSERNGQCDETSCAYQTWSHNVLHFIATASISNAVWVLVAFLLLSEMMGAVLWNHLLVLTMPSEWLSVCNQGPHVGSTNKVRGRQSLILMCFRFHKSVSCSTCTSHQKAPK